MTDTAALRLPAGVCDGHFPGQAIVPGFALLAAAWSHYVSQAAADPATHEGPRTRIVGVRSARFRHTVAPSEALSVAGRRDGDIVRLDVRRDGAIVADAAFVLGELRGLAPSGAAIDREPSSARELPAAELDARLPHRAPVRMLRTLMRQDDDGIVCAARVAADYSLVSNGHVTVLAAVEAAAQAAAFWGAATGAWKQAANSGPRIGYLVGVRDVSWAASTIAADKAFVVSARLVAIAEPLTHYAIAATVDGRTILQGSIATVLAKPLRQ